MKFNLTLPNLFHVSSFHGIKGVKAGPKPDMSDLKHCRINLS